MASRFVFNPRALPFFTPCQTPNQGPDNDHSELESTDVENEVWWDGQSDYSYFSTDQKYQFVGYQDGNPIYIYSLACCHWPATEAKQQPSSRQDATHSNARQDDHDHDHVSLPQKGHTTIDVLSRRPGEADESSESSESSENGEFDRSVVTEPESDHSSQSSIEPEWLWAQERLQAARKALDLQYSDNPRDQVHCHKTSGSTNTNKLKASHRDSFVAPTERGFGPSFLQCQRGRPEPEEDADLDIAAAVEVGADIAEPVEEFQIQEEEENEHTAEPLYDYPPSPPSPTLAITSSSTCMSPTTASFSYNPDLELNGDTVALISAQEKEELESSSSLDRADKARRTEWGFHHTSFFTVRVSHASQTDPSLSLAVLMAPPKPYLFDHELNLHRFTVIREAHRYIDPVVVKLSPEAFQESIRGWQNTRTVYEEMGRHTRKLYPNRGNWMNEQAEAQAASRNQDLEHVTVTATATNTDVDTQMQTQTDTATWCDYGDPEIYDMTASSYESSASLSSIPDPSPRKHYGTSTPRSQSTPEHARREEGGSEGGGDEYDDGDEDDGNESEERVCTVVNGWHRTRSRTTNTVVVPTISDYLGQRDTVIGQFMAEEKKRRGELWRCRRCGGDRSPGFRCRQKAHESSYEEDQQSHRCECLASGTSRMRISEIMHGDDDDDDDEKKAVSSVDSKKSRSLLSERGTHSRHRANGPTEGEKRRRRRKRRKGKNVEPFPCIDRQTTL